jgi:hypothetical protein
MAPRRRPSLHIWPRFGDALGTGLKLELAEVGRQLDRAAEGVGGFRQDGRCQGLGGHVRK